eukprot:Em0015g1023a
MDEKGYLLASIQQKDHNGEFKPRNIVSFGTCWLLYTIATSSLSMLGPFFPAEAAARGASSGIVGAIFSISPLCVTVLSPVLGYHLHQFGLKFALVAGTLLMGASFLLFGFVTQAPAGVVFISLCFFLQFGQGLGCAMLTTAAYALVGTLFNRRFGMFMGFMEFAGGLGCTLGPLVGGSLYHLYKFELPFYVIGGALLFFTVPMFLIIEPAGPHNKHQYSPKIGRKLLTNPMYLTLILCDVIAMAGLFVFVPILSPYLLQEFVLDPFKIGVVSSVDSIFYMLLGLFAVPLFERCRIPPRPFIIISLVIAGAGYVLMGPAKFLTTPQLWITVLGLAGAGFGCALTILLTYLEMMSVAREELIHSNENEIDAVPGLIAGTVACALSCGELVGPLLGGVLREKLDFTETTTTFGGVLVAQAILLFLVSTIHTCYKRTT